MKICYICRTTYNICRYESTCHFKSIHRRTKDRIVDAFLEGLIDRKNRDLRLSKLQDDVRVHQEYLSGLQGKSMALARMLEGGPKDAMQSLNNRVIKKSGHCIGPLEI